MPRRGSMKAGGLRARRCSHLCAPKDRADPRRSHPRGQDAASAFVCPVRFICGVRSTWRFPMQTMQAAETTKVIYGVNELELDLAGKTVRGIWKVLEQVFNIPRDAVVTVSRSDTLASVDRRRLPARCSTASGRAPSTAAFPTARSTSTRFRTRRAAAPGSASRPARSRGVWTYRCTTRPRRRPLASLGRTISAGLVTGIETIVTNAIDQPIPTG